MASLDPGLLRGIFIGLMALAVLGALAAAARTRPVPTTFLGHVDDLRRRLLISAAAFFLASSLAFGFRARPTGFPLAPSLHDNMAAQVFGVLRRDLVPPEVRLIATSPLDGFMAEFLLSLGLGFVFSLPVLLWQLGGFLAPALAPKERRILRLAFLPALVLFALGVAFGYVYVLPFLFATLYAYSAALDAELFLVLQDFLTFTFGLLLVLGVAFQTPLVMVVLTRVGVVPAATWRRYWRHAVIAIAVVSALVTDPTIVSQVLVAIPLLLLYALGAVVATLVE